MPATRVYISSTYPDLKEHRAELIDFFQKFPDLFSLVSMEGYVAGDFTPPFTFEEMLYSPQYHVCRNGLLMKLNT